MLGRTYKTVYAGASGAPFSIAYFNNKGQLTNQIDPDGVSTLYVYNGEGEQTHTIVDMDQDHVVDFAGDDRITLVTNDVVTAYSTDVRRTRTYAWAGSGDLSTLLSTVETSADGLRTWSTLWNNGVAVTSSNLTLYVPGSGLRVVTSTAPDGSYTVTTNRKR